VIFQVRVELGILQLEADGRPDGLGFRDSTSALAWFQAHPQPQLLDLAAVSAIASEMAQRRQRSLACAMLEDWPRVRRDAIDNVQALDLVSARASEPSDRDRFEAWRPHEISMRARAEATIAIAGGRRDIATAALDAGLRSVHESMKQQGHADRAATSPESMLLRMLLDALTLKLPASQRIELQARLRQAVLGENYELAAILRDELRLMEGES